MMLRPRHEGFMSNLTLRFVYEAYLELAICCLISLHISDTDSSPMSGVQWLISVCISVVLLALPGFLLYSLMSSGTSIRGYYNESICYLCCCWGQREKNKNFNAKEYLAENAKIKKLKSHLIDPLDL